MANTIIVKKSSVAGKVPVAGDLQVGELAVNVTDRKIYTKDSTGAVVQLGGGSGSGDVVGPASATDNALVRFDTTTGKLIQNGIITQDDNGNLAAVNGLSFNTSPTSAPSTAGSVFWDSGDGTPSVVLNADTSLQLGQENIAKVYNGTGLTIAKGSVVAVSGAQGQRPSVVLADADSEALSAPTLGITAEAIVNGAEGFVCTFGVVRGLNTAAYTAGAPIYLSGTAGAFTDTKPVAPQHTVALGWVIKVNSSSGEIFVNINNGWELDELHNVLITSPASGNTLIYDASSSLWKNASLTASTGISVTNGAGSITIANTAPDQTVALTGGTGISTSGTYPNFTITNTAPDQTVSLTGAGATSISGTYPNFTISSVNTTYSAATSTVAGLIELASDTQQSVAANAVTATASRTYGLQVNSAGQGVVNVPWTDTVYTLPAATSTVLGGIELGSDTVQTTAANAVTSTANRTYALQVNSAGQGVVNVPWTDTVGTVTSVSMTTPTGLSVSGSPITTSGTLALTMTAGYSIPTTASQSNWDTAYTQRLQWDGGSTNLVAATGRTSLGATTVGANLFTLTNPSAVTFPRFNADNTVSALDAATFRTAIGAGTGSGTVTSVGGTGSVNGITLSGTVTSSGNLTLGGTLSGVSLTTQVSGTLPVANGGTGATTAATARSNLGATTVGGNMFTLTNPSAVTFPRFNADNTVSALDAATFRSAIGAASSSGTGKVLQMVTAVPSATNLSTGSTTYTTTNISASITPSSTTSKIVVLINCMVDTGTNNSISTKFQLTRNGSQIWQGINAARYSINSYYNGTSNWKVQYVDSPSSTSALTYLLNYAIYAISSSYYDITGVRNADFPGSIILLEVAP